MATASVGEIEICYETFGDPGGPPLLLIMGLGAQMIAWPDEFCQGLADRAFHVIRFDNRDCGLSTFVEGPSDPAAAIAAITAGEAVAPAYGLSDLAADAAGLLDALDIDAAHIVGASMGGMIAQLVAIEHPHKTLSLTSIMSTTGEAEVGQATPEALEAILAPAPADPAAAIEHSITIGKIWASPEYWNEDWARQQATRNVERIGTPRSDGTGRQAIAIITAEHRADRLGTLDCPTLVVHGTVDPLVQPDGGARTAEVIPGAELLEVEGMGHDLPPEVFAQIIESITRLAIRAAAGV